MDRKIVKQYNKGCGNRMRNSMVAYMRVVKKMDRENGCWKEKKSKWTQAHIRDMLGAILGELMNIFMNSTNRARETY